MQLSRRVFVFPALLFVLCSFTSCELEQTVETGLQTAVQEIWSIGWVKAAMESKSEEALLPGLKKLLVGKKFIESWTGNVYIHDVKWTDVKLGNTPPAFDVTGLTWWETPTHYYLNVGWAIDWPKPNGSEVRFKLDLRAWHGFPDHTVRLYDLNTQAQGNTLVTIPKSLAVRGVVSVSVSQFQMDLKADAKGWFWTVDISNKAKKLLSEKLVGYLVDQTFQRAFGPYL